MFFVFRKQARKVESTHESLIAQAQALKEAVKAADEAATQQAANTAAAMNVLADELGRIGQVRQKLQGIDIKF